MATRLRLSDQMERQHGERDEAGQDDDEGHGHLEGGADDGGHARGAQVVRGEDALDDEEVRGPVAETDDQAEAEDDAGPVHAHGVVVEVAESAATDGRIRCGPCW